ncbi:unnamed protein product [Orchesella dallaii]|uniref:Uncharacterized protein n=1 Tax=Orchesella dallaii TaxID=48710 RepID=A0ABP1RRE9_9HEXA
MRKKIWAVYYKMNEVANLETEKTNAADFGASETTIVPVFEGAVDFGELTQQPFEPLLDSETSKTFNQNVENAGATIPLEKKPSSSKKKAIGNPIVKTPTGTASRVLSLSSKVNASATDESKQWEISSWSIEKGALFRKKKGTKSSAKELKESIEAKRKIDIDASVDATPTVPRKKSKTNQLSNLPLPSKPETNNIKKKYRLQEKWTVAEFTDRLLDKKTKDWGVEKDEQTNKFYITFYE